jgi:hypothetical protein
MPLHLVSGVACITKWVLVCKSKPIEVFLLFRTMFVLFLPALWSHVLAIYINCEFWPMNSDIFSWTSELLFLSVFIKLRLYLGDVDSLCILVLRLLTLYVLIVRFKIRGWFLLLFWVMFHSPLVLLFDPVWSRLYGREARRWALLPPLRVACRLTVFREQDHSRGCSASCVCSFGSVNIHPALYRRRAVVMVWFGLNYKH